MNARGPKGPRRSWDVTDIHLYDRAHEHTAAQEKVWSYLNGIVQQPEIQKQIRMIRKLSGIRISGSRKRPSQMNVTTLLRKTDAMRQELGLDFMWILTLADYVIHNEWRWHSSYGGLLDLVDEREGLRPIALRISPYASMNDITDYVEKMYKSAIEPLQNKYKDSKLLIGKFKRRRTRIAMRNEFIFKHRTESAKTLVRLVRDRFGEVLDYTYISQIIRDEKKKRSGVR